MKNKEETSKPKISLAEYAPEIAAQWHPTKNDKLSPNSVTTKSNRKVWWVCEKGHEWEAIIHNRTSGQGCPYCAGRYAIQGKTDLATVHPELAMEWHPTKNENLTPEMVTQCSEKKVWWLGPCGHEWDASVAMRTNGTGCPICSSRRLLSGINDLATVNPELAAQWHPTKNGNLTPSMVFPNSIRKVWWLCPKCGHEWEAKIPERNRNVRCSYCTNNWIDEGKNTLANKYPNLAVEWHPTKNGGLMPEMVTPGSKKKVCWLGLCGHEWEAMIQTRTRGQGCPICKALKKTRKNEATK